MIVDSAALAAGVWGVVGDLIPAGQRMAAAGDRLAVREVWRRTAPFGRPALRGRRRRLHRSGCQDH